MSADATYVGKDGGKINSSIAWYDTLAERAEVVPDAEREAKRRRVGQECPRNRLFRKID